MPQLLYQFSVLCIKIPKSFFDALDKLFFKFIWKGGNDRVKRKTMCLDYSDGGLKMIDPYKFALAQKMVWVHHLLDDNYSCAWKTIEISALKDFFLDFEIFWNSHVPESVLNKLGNNQVAESIKTWYVFRKYVLENVLKITPEEFSAQQCLWFNKQIRSKSKQYFFLSRLV